MNGEDFHDRGEQHHVNQGADEGLRDQEVVERKENEVDESEVCRPALGKTDIDLPKEKVSLCQQCGNAQNERQSIEFARPCKYGEPGEQQEVERDLKEALNDGMRRSRSNGRGRRHRIAVSLLRSPDAK